MSHTFSTDAPTTPATAAGAPVRSPARGVVLVVDDESMVAGAVAQILARSGYAVHTAAGPAEAELRFDELGGQVDLLLTDVVMPDGGGRRLADRLRERFPSLRVLFMSGYTEHDSVRDDRALSAPLITKPFSGSRLVAMVQRVLEGA